MKHIHGVGFAALKFAVFSFHTQEGRIMRQRRLLFATRRLWSFVSLLLSLNQKEQVMTYHRSWYRNALAGFALIAGLGLVSSPALAQFLPQGTTTAGGVSANTDITNQATLNYSISGTGQPAINSNTTTFKVDNLVRVVVAEVGGTFTAVAPNATGQVTTFTVTNTGNTIQDYALTVNGAIATGQSVTLGGTPYNDSNVPATNFNVTGCSAFVDNGVTAGYQVGQDTAQAVLNLSPVGGSNTVTVHVVCTVPNAASGAVNGNNALVSLTAATSNAGTCAANGTGCAATTQTAGADTPTAVDVVFADAAGSDDAARDGAHSARDVYQVLAAVISVNKTVVVLCDPINFNGTGGAGFFPPKNIPGAYVRYEITIANAVGAASATLTDITDALNANTAFDADLRTGSGAACAASAPASAAGSGFRLTCTGTTRASGAGTCANAAGQFFTTANDGDAMFFAAGSVTARFGTGGGAVTGAQALPAEAGYTAGELKGGESVTIRFNAIIN
jgi:hypothetical protein